MPVTQATALAAIRERLNEPVERFFKDIFLRRLINEGARDIARTTNALFDQVDVALVANIAEYTIDSSILLIHQAEWIPGDGRRVPLEGRTREAMNRIWLTRQDQIPGDPALYTVWGFPPNLKLKLFPVPYINSTLRLFVSRLPVDLAVDTTTDANSYIDFPEGWVEVLYDYVELRATRKDRDPRWQEAKQLYDQNVQNMQLAADSYIRDTSEIVRGGVLSGDLWFLDW